MPDVESRANAVLYLQDKHQNRCDCALCSNDDICLLSHTVSMARDLLLLTLAASTEPPSSNFLSVRPVLTAALHRHIREPAKVADLKPRLTFALFKISDRRDADVEDFNFLYGPSSDARLTAYSYLAGTVVEAWLKQHNVVGKKQGFP